jgi:hypothetical protein
MTDPLELVPIALRPAGLQLPSAVADALAGMGRMPAVAVPPEQLRLMRRLDSKYVLPRVQLPALLESLADRFLVLTSAGQYAARYVTVYFDSEQRHFLRDHLRGRRPRHKLRVRHYLERGLSSLEIKSKTPGGHTDKKHRAHAFGSNLLDADERRWAALATGLTQPMEAQAWTSCQRITLLHTHAACRMTIDLNVSLGSRGGARTLQDRALIELKREQSRGDPLLSQALHNAGARPVGLSKYVAAMMDGSGGERRGRFVAVLGRLARAEYWKECQA